MKCVDCSNGVAFGCKYCVSCLAKSKTRSAERYNKLKAERVCKTCSKPTESGISCSECKTKKKSTFQYRKKAGLCVTCGTNPADQNQKCRGCHETYVANTTAKKQARLSKGLCAFCDEPRVGTQLCVEHYLKFTAKTHLGTSKRYDELRALFDKQQGVCPYTGFLLRLGVDASIDHIVAKSSGGSHEVDNLQWVYYKANFMKQDMGELEFLELVKKICEHRSLR